MVKILVTGGAGFVGSNLISLLLENPNYEVHSLDNYDSGRRENEIKGCNYHTGDIESIDLMDKDFNVIFHLAALSRIQPSFSNPTETFRVNVQGTQAVCDFARKIGAKVIYAGSSSKWHDPYQSPYACYKYLGEEVCKMYKKTYGLDIEIARFYNVYGPNEIIDGDWAAVIGIWRRQIKNNESITIVGDGEQRRDFTHVYDIINGLSLIAFSNEKHEDAWELGTGKNFSINEVYEIFKEKFGCNKLYIPEQNGNYRETIRINDDAINKLGWQPKMDLRTYILSLN